MTPQESCGQLYDLLGGESHIQIPFRYESNFIVVTVQFNGAFPMNFIFDTGAEHTLLFKRTFTDILGAQYEKKIKIYGSDLESHVFAHIVRNINVRVAPIQDVKMDFLVMEEDYLQMDQLTGMSIDGILGAQFFRHHVVKIDYRRGILTLYKKEAFKKPGNKYDSFPMDLKRNKPYVAARSFINRIDSAELTLLLDTGAGIGLLLHSNTHEQIKLPDNFIQTNLGLGLGGELNGYLGRVARFNLSNFSFSNVITAFQDVALEEEQIRTVKRNGIIGNQILSRFTVIIDYPNSMIYMRPLRSFHNKFEYDRSGMIISAGGPYLNNFTVLRILPNSPAEEVGIKSGDRIVKIRGIPTSLYSLSKITKIFRGKEDRRVRFTIKRGKERMRKSLFLREIL